MSDLTELQEHLGHLKKQVELKEQTERLLENNDFKEVILKGFCEDEMKRQLGLAVCERLPQDVRDLCNQLAKSSAALSNYLTTNVRIGMTAEEDIEQVQAQIEELQKQGEE